MFVLKVKRKKKKRKIKRKSDKTVRSRGVPKEGKWNCVRVDFVARSVILMVFGRDSANEKGDDVRGGGRGGGRGLKNFQAVTICVLATNLRVRPEVFEDVVDFDKLIFRFS